MNPLRLTAVLVAAALAGPARAQEKADLELSDGTKVDPAKVYDLPNAKGADAPERCWVMVAGESFGAKPGGGAGARGSEPTQFMQGAYVWERKTAEGAEYLLLAEKDLGDSVRVARPLGWVPADLVISALSATPIFDPETRIHRKAMIVNKAGDIKKALEHPPPPLAELTAADAAELDKGDVPAALTAGLKSHRLALNTPKVVKREKGAGWVVLDAPKDASGGTGVVRQWFDVVRDTAKPGQWVVRDSLNQASVLDRPGRADALRRKNFALFNVFFVYRELKDHMLLGSAAQFGDSDVDRVMHGWVHKDRLTVWNTREAVEWDVRSTLPGAVPRRPPTGSIFPDADAAKAWLDCLVAGDPDGAAKVVEREGGFGEVPDRPKNPDHSRPLRGAEMRFPVLGVEKAKHPKTDAILTRVGVAGPLLGGTTRADAADIARQRARINQAIEELLTIEILFVIDGTGSMERHYATVQQTIRSAVRELNALRNTGGYFEKLRLRVTFAFYADGESKTPVDVLRPLTLPGRAARDNPAEVISPELVVPNARTKDVADAEIRARIARVGGDLTDRKRMDSDNDANEWVFRGITEGVEKAGFSGGSTQWVILMGDGGSDPKDAVTQADVVRALAGGARPRNLFVLHNEPPPAGKTRHASAQLLNDQMKGVFKELKEKTGGAAEVEYVSLVDKGDEQTGARISQLLNTRLTAILKEVIIDSGTLSEFAAGGIPTVAKEGLLKLLRSNNVDVDLLAGGGVQVYQEGYVYDKVVVNGNPRVPQIRTTFKVAETEARALLAFLSAVTSEAAIIGGKPEDFREFVKAELKALVAESGLTGKDRVEAEKNPKEFFKRRGGLKFATRLLNMDDLDTLPLPNRKERERLVEVKSALEELLDRPTEVSEWKAVWKPAEKKGGAEVLVAVAKNTRKLASREEGRRYTDPGNGTVWLWLDAEVHLP